MKTLLFCTSYATTPEEWNGRYKSWYDYYTSIKLNYDKMLMFDDGSPLMPKFCSSDTIHTFRTHLGKKSVLDYDGWYRSFSTAIRYAKENNFDKIVHCEADAYLLSNNIIDFVNCINSGWHCFWCPRHNMHESALQVICDDQFDSCIEFTNKPYDAYRGKAIDDLFPYTKIQTAFKGDRYGEYLTEIPHDAHYSCQTSTSMINNWKK